MSDEKQKAKGTNPPPTYNGGMNPQAQYGGYPVSPGAYGQPYGYGSAYQGMQYPATAYQGVPGQVAGQMTQGQTGAPSAYPPQQDDMLPLQQSYIENILRLNKGKVATIYQTFENNQEWNAKVFRGRIEAAGRDHIILSDVETEKRYLLLMIYVDYITFEGPIEYTYPAQLYTY